MSTGLYSFTVSVIFVNASSAAVFLSFIKIDSIKSEEITISDSHLDVSDEVKHAKN